MTMSTEQVYEIRIKGHLGSGWSEWFGGLTVTTLENGETILSGLITDQPALFGVLAQVGDLGLPLISVKRVEQT